MSQYTSLAEPFNLCMFQLPQLLTGDTDTSPMVKPWEGQGKGHVCTNCFAAIRKGEMGKSTISS